MALLERAAGIEPVYRAWQARELTIVLRPQVWSGITDLNRHHLLGGQKYYHYTNPAFLAGAEGVEPSPVVLETIILPLYEAPMLVPSIGIEPITY